VSLVVRDSCLGRCLAAGRSLGGVLFAGAAGVCNEHGDVTAVGAVAYRRFDPDLHCYADSDECVDPAIPQEREIQPSAIKHRNDTLGWMTSNQLCFCGFSLYTEMEPPES